LKGKQKQKQSEIEKASRPGRVRRSTSHITSFGSTSPRVICKVRNHFGFQIKKDGELLIGIE
jgi:hypothetical protein